MEGESDSHETYLSPQIDRRRRHSSVSDDYSVQKTNDDATECKHVAVQLNYWEDPFISKFVPSHSEQHKARRDPEISRGYWARITGIRSLLTDFIAEAGDKCQIISLGAGFDTNYWWLKQCRKVKFAKYVEFDFSSVTAKKMRLIRRPGNNLLTDTFSDKIQENQHCDLQAGDYHLLGTDLRQIEEFKGKFAKAALDPSAPTIVLAECVLVYMNPDKSAEVLKFVSSFFNVVSFVNYEQVCMEDSFGRVMVQNLSARGIHLQGLPLSASIVEQKSRFQENGFDFVKLWKMSDVYTNLLPKVDIERIEKLEMLDEKELLIQLLEHYCITYTFKCNSHLQETYNGLKDLSL
uniref:Leucine carboxyl methyltransferase 1 n=1 Tax=Rhabditophanes sp. KR3021 TaxID=114890 RepID=A0AC35TP95_9BILA